MPTNEQVVRTFNAVKYDGTNAADCVAVISGSVLSTSTFASPSAPMDDPLIILENGWYPYYVPLGMWMVCCPEEYGIHILLSDANMAKAFRRTPELAATIAPALPDQKLPKSLSWGLESIPTLALGGSATVQVPIIPALPDKLYTATASLKGATSVLAGLSITGTTIVSGSRVDVTVQNVGVITLAGALAVVRCS